MKRERGGEERGKPRAVLVGIERRSMRGRIEPTLAELSRLADTAGAEVVGGFLMQIFFAVIGASANIGMVLKVGPSLFFFAGLILAIHLVFLLIVGRLLGLDLLELVIASNANMGGPTTAAAMAVARRWDKLVLPAILCGTLGYAVATFVGVGLGNWLK